MTLLLPKQSFCLIRHGESRANEAGVIAGRLDVELSDRGRQQAEALRDVVWPEAKTLFVSPQSRAIDTCRIGFPDQPFQIYPDLRERDWGIYDGRPLAELPDRDSRPEGGEDWQGMIHRVKVAIHSCCALSVGTLPVFVCHSGVIRATRLLMGQGNVGIRPNNATPILIEWTGQGHRERLFALD